MKKKGSAIMPKTWWAGGLLLGILSAAFVQLVVLPSKKENANITHIHGLGFTNDGTQLLIPAHEGIMAYRNDRWNPFEGDKHDYMGFNLVDDGFYSSGHPALGSDLVNPLGIVKVTNDGETIIPLDLQGVMDFHGMAAGYKTHAIYVYNPEANTRLSTSGVYVTLDNAKTWKKSELNGLDGQMTAIAAHPSDPQTVAIGTSNGVFLSSNYGDQFKKLALEEEVTAVAFGKNGDLFIGGKKLLWQINEEIRSLITPALNPNDFITYIAQNPQIENEIAFSTSERNVFLSRDKGISWIKIAVKGIGI
ncbi:F510_1955 family glycosylhydrolase [Paenibacillus sp. MMO-58]|uniref:F510_1955 family glycosylhydrolase n=1 Tax=Paenibacillus sp. MMO-58 TaxID=3081290 RepID=UPI003017423D